MRISKWADNGKTIIWEDFVKLNQGIPMKKNSSKILILFALVIMRLDELQ